MQLQQPFEAVQGKVVVIHSEQRKDRAKVLETWSRMYGIPQLNVFPAILDEDGRKGCAMSHIALCKALSDMNAETALILEDDAMPCPQAFQNAHLLSDVIDCVKSNTFDIVWLGGLPMWFHRKTQWAHILEGKCYTTHAMILSRRAMEWIKSVKYMGKPIDVVLANAPLKTAFCHGSLFEQTLTPSNVRKSLLSRTDAFGELLYMGTPLWKSAIVHKRAILIAVLSVLVVTLFLQNK